ncbi:hypothetical protein QTP86_024961, partial [Hemibagrus guttatus]
MTHARPFQGWYRDRDRLWTVSLWNLTKTGYGALRASLETGTTITKELKWEQNISSLTKKAQQRTYFLRQLKKFLLPVKMLVNFYTAIIESIHTSSITVWFAAATARDKAKLQRVIHSAEKVIRCSLPSLLE